MEFHENRAKAPFIGLVQLWQAVRRWRGKCRPDACYSR
ncbi:protein YjiS [Escherichia coli]|uniref:Protein YjiS n=1 Tax=Escherichia coli TaxID=562 RepID=A0A377APQ0_ECOLX|nr:protein YjiS [Escherichia coli]